MHWYDIVLTCIVGAYDCADIAPSKVATRGAGVAHTPRDAIGCVVPSFAISTHSTGNTPAASMQNTLGNVGPSEADKTVMMLRLMKGH